jgi:hypothetical protein
MEEESVGDVIGAFQLSQRGLVRDASFVGVLLVLLLVLGTAYPKAILMGRGAAASLILVLPASATALLAQRFPEPVTEDFAHLVRRSLLVVTLIGFAAAVVGGLRLISSPDFLAICSAAALLFTAVPVGLMIRLGFRPRERDSDWPVRWPPANIIQKDVRGAFRFSVWLTVVSVVSALILAMIGIIWS